MNPTARPFIQACASVFITIGAVGVAASFAFPASVIVADVGILALWPVLVAVIGAASTLLIRGSSHVACSIDARLGGMAAAALTFPPSSSTSR